MPNYQEPRLLLYVLEEMIAVIPEGEEFGDALRQRKKEELYVAPEASDWHRVAFDINHHLATREEPWIEKLLGIWMNKPDFKFPPKP